MTTTNTINGSWYIVELDQQAKDQPNAALVLDWGRGLFRDYDLKFLPEAKKSLEELSEITALGKVENQSFIYGSTVNYWDPLSTRRLVRTNDETFEGVGNLGISDRSYTQERWITPQVAEGVLKADAQRPLYIPAKLYVVRYRDSRDRNTNPFHQTAVIAKDEEDLRQFRQKEFPNWFYEGNRVLTEMTDSSELRFLKGIVIMPEVISGFQKRSKEE